MPLRCSQPEPTARSKDRACQAIRTVCRQGATLLLLLFGLVVDLHAAPPPPIGPIITNQPQDQITEAGGRATFGVGLANSLTPLRYQWTFNGVNRTGATNQSLILTNVQVGDAGSYRVAV